MVRPGLKDKYESLLMANYSTFYHCVVAYSRLEAGRKAKDERGFGHPELFFFSAKACIDNLVSFREDAHANAPGSWDRANASNISEKPG